MRDIILLGSTTKKTLLRWAWPGWYNLCSDRFKLANALADGKKRPCWGIPKLWVTRDMHIYIYINIYVYIIYIYIYTDTLTSPQGPPIPWGHFGYSLKQAFSDDRMPPRPPPPPFRIWIGKNSLAFKTVVLGWNIARMRKHSSMEKWMPTFFGTLVAGQRGSVLLDLCLI